MSYVLMFRPIFCPRMPWRTSWEISWSSLGMGSIVPASGAAGLALGAWILHEGGMDADHIARRSVAFFLIKSMVNFVAVAVLGTLMALGILGPDQSAVADGAPGRRRGDRDRARPGDSAPRSRGGPAVPTRAASGAR